MIDRSAAATSMRGWSSSVEERVERRTIEPPSRSGDERLADLVRELLGKVSVTTGARTSLTDETVGPPDGIAKAIIHRVALEALANVRKHARAERVDVTLAEREGGYLLRVRDDGVGFDPDRPQARPDHIGLASVRKRAEAAGGWLRLDSAPGVGTTLEMWVPGEAANER